MPTPPGDRIVLLLATGFGFGTVRFAPGTIGSLWGLPLAWGLQEAGLAGWGWAIVATAIALLGVPICGRAAALLGQKDPASVVFDEIAAFPIVFAFADVNWLTGTLGFALFRLFDIWKPWPVRQCERFPKGWGIMADDLAAAAYAGLVLVVAHRWLA